MLVREFELLVIKSGPDILPVHQAIGQTASDAEEGNGVSVLSSVVSAVTLMLGLFASLWKI